MSNSAQEVIDKALETSGLLDPKHREDVSAFVLSELREAGHLREGWEYTWEKYDTPQLNLFEQYPTEPAENSVYRRHPASPWERFR